jgi:hypothetical protein
VVGVVLPCLGTRALGRDITCMHIIVTNATAAAVDRHKGSPDGPETPGTHRQAANRQPTDQLPPSRLSPPSHR